MWPTIVGKTDGVTGFASELGSQAGRNVPDSCNLLPRSQVLLPVILDEMITNSARTTGAEVCKTESWSSSKAMLMGYHASPCLSQHFLNNLSQQGRDFLSQVYGLKMSLLYPGVTL